MGSARWSSGVLLLIGATAWAGDTNWEQIVGERLHSQARAIYWYGSQPLAALPAIEAKATFDAEGVVFSDPRGELLSLSFVRWGRDGEVRAVGAQQPTVGACIAGIEAAPDGGCIRTLERIHGSVTEWWVGLGTGLEQGWTVDAPPPGEGPIRFETEVEGALLVEAAGDIGWLTDSTGQLWQVSDVVAWDATGRPLPTRIDARDSRLIVSVDDTGAVWPITVDPVYTTAASVLSGYDVGDQFGFSVSDAGDVNNDGYDDVIVGAYDLYDIGGAYIFEGSASGVDSDADTSLSGNDTDDGFGSSVSGAGDIDGDGYDDVIVGASGANSGEGEAYIYTGSASGIVRTSQTVLSTSESGAAFGTSVSNAGDINNDGYDDVIVGAPEADSTDGEAYIYMGTSSGISTTVGTTLSGNNRFGFSVSDAGDVNDDGYDDVIIGSGIDEAYVYIGTAVGLDPINTTLSGGSGFGEVVSGAGDVDGDGYDDVIVVATGAEVANLFSGSSGGVSTSSSATLTGSLGSGFGGALSDAGDVNGDGYDDVIVGSEINEAYLYIGDAAGLSTTVDTTLTGSNVFGGAVSGAGDVNGDGYNDVIVGAYGFPTTTGDAYIFHGYCTDADADGYCVYDDCDDTDAAINEESTFYADSDGDGYGDAASTTEDCDPPTGYVVDDTDCDDDDITSYPGADELCDEVDNDCDGVIDEGAVSTYYADSDGDGYGDSTDTVEDCDPPSGYTADGTDCDDEEAAANPGETEICDDIDNDCDGGIDEDLTTSYYPDEDGDSYGRPANVVEACETPDGYVEDFTDCDDADATIHPEAEDAPNDAIDSDCDGVDPARWVQGGASCATTSGGGGWAGLLMLMMLLRRRTER